ncbi:MAG: hypothetical protein ACK6DS_12885 [Planctomycetota bacterium]
MGAFPPPLYEQLDKRQPLAGDSQADGDQAPLLLDLPPVVSATLERMLSSGGDFNSGLWRSAPDQPSSVRFVPFSAGPRASPRFSSALTPRRTASAGRIPRTFPGHLPAGDRLSAV